MTTSAQGYGLPDVKVSAAAERVQAVEPVRVLLPHAVEHGRLPQHRPRRVHVPHLDQLQHHLRPRANMLYACMKRQIVGPIMSIHRRLLQHSTKALSAPGLPVMRRQGTKSYMQCHPPHHRTSVLQLAACKRSICVSPDPQKTLLRRNMPMCRRKARRACS